MDIQEVLEIIEDELDMAKRSYDSAVIAERLRKEKNSNETEERYEGLNLAAELFKLTYSQGKNDCIDCLNSRMVTINPHREAFLDGYKFVCRIVNQWKS